MNEDILTDFDRIRHVGMTCLCILYGLNKTSHPLFLLYLCCIEVFNVTCALLTFSVKDRL